MSCSCWEAYLYHERMDVLCKVDATELETSPLLDKNYDMVIFNFPHVGLGIKEQNDNIEVNQVSNSAALFLRDVDRK